MPELADAWGALSALDARTIWNGIPDDLRGWKGWDAWVP